MTFKNTETGQEGTLTMLLPHISSPRNLTVEELEDMGIIKVEPQPKILSLEELQSIKIDEINYSFDLIRKQGLITSLGIKMDNTEESLTNMLELKQLMEQLGENLSVVEVRDFDNVDHPLSFEQVRQIVIEMGISKLTLFKTRRALKDYIRNAESKEQIQDVWWARMKIDDEDMEISKFEINDNLNKLIGGN